MERYCLDKTQHCEPVYSKSLVLPPSACVRVLGSNFRDKSFIRVSGPSYSVYLQCLTLKTVPLRGCWFCRHNREQLFHLGKFLTTNCVAVVSGQAWLSCNLLQELCPVNTNFMMTLMHWLLTNSRKWVGICQRKLLACLPGVTSVQPVACVYCQTFKTLSVVTERIKTVWLRACLTRKKPVERN